MRSFWCTHPRPTRDPQEGGYHTLVKGNQATSHFQVSATGNIGGLFPHLSLLEVLSVVKAMHASGKIFNNRMTVEGSLG